MSSEKMKNKITKILAEEIKDSKNNPTIKVTVFACPSETLVEEGGDIFANFSVPSGASTGIHEAHELRDEDGKGVKKAIWNVENIIAPALIGQDIFVQKKIPIEYRKHALNQYLGVIPLFGNAIIIVAFLIALLLAFPIQPRIKSAITESRLAKPLISQTQKVERLVTKIFGTIPMLEQVVYMAVGVAAVIEVAMHMESCKWCSKRKK